MVQNGKRVTKPNAKKIIANFIARIALGCIKDKTTGMVLQLGNLDDNRVEKIQAEMNEYKFTRRSIHDTITCLMYEYTKENLADIHEFCYNRLVDGNK